MKTGSGRTFVCWFFAALTSAAAAPAVAQSPKEGSAAEKGVFHGLGPGGAGGADGLFDTSGDGKVDLLMMMDLFRVEAQYHAKSNFFFIDDGAGPNAFWTPRTFGGKGFIQEEGRLGTLLMGQNLIKAELKATPDGGPRNFTIAAILAHELGHMLQFVRKTKLPIPRQELQADFLAGWSIRCAQRQGNPDIDEAAVFTSFYKKGDDDFFNLRHHGTKKDRLNAFLAGFAVESGDIDVAYAAGERYVKTLTAGVFMNLTSEEESNKLGLFYETIKGPGGSTGALVTRFPYDDSPAGRCGIEMGDIIIEFGSKRIHELPRQSFDLSDFSGAVKIKVIDVRTGKPSETTILTR